MVINISVQYSGGLLPDRLNTMEWLCIYNLCNVYYYYGVMVYYTVLYLMFFWCPYMAINVNVQYNGGFLPDIILTAYFQHAHFIPIVGVGKRGEY